MEIFNYASYGWKKRMVPIELFAKIHERIINLRNHFIIYNYTCKNMYRLKVNIYWYLHYSKTWSHISKPLYFRTNLMHRLEAIKTYHPLFLSIFSQVDNNQWCGSSIWGSILVILGNFQPSHSRPSTLNLSWRKFNVHTRKDALKDLFFFFRENRILPIYLFSLIQHSQPCLQSPHSCLISHIHYSPLLVTYHG